MSGVLVSCGTAPAVDAQKPTDAATAAAASPSAIVDEAGRSACRPATVTSAPDQGPRDRPVGVLALVPGSAVPAGWSALDGADVEVNANSVLFSQLGTAFGGDARPTFRLPQAGGPWTQFPGPDGTCLTWVLESVGYLPDGAPADGYPGQVYFTAVQREQFAGTLVEAGARPNDLGSAIAPGIRAFDLPLQWRPPTVPPLSGEVRLFSESAPLPGGFSPIDLPAAPGYRWAVADGRDR